MSNKTGESIINENKEMVYIYLDWIKHLFKNFQGLNS